ncbi:MAG: type II toxin-antitoxin system HicA family toxin [Pseudonocardiaceae bacterium]
MERHLRDQGCELLRQGGNHEVWWNPLSRKRSSLPRHRQIPLTTARAICRQLEVAPI